MQQIHVLHIIDGLKIGGAEMQLCQLVRRLRSERYRVTVCYSTPGPLEAEMAALGVPMFRLPRLARIDPLLLWGMCRVIRRDPPHIVHTHLFKSDFHGRFAARLCGVPLVISSLRNCYGWAKNPLLGRSYGATARFVDRLIAVSEDVRQYAIQYTGVPPEKVVTIDNGVDTRRFEGQEAAGRAVREELEIEAAAPVITIVGRLNPQKDHRTFLLAAAQIAQAIPRARFLIVGEGPLLEKLKAQTAELALTPTVIFCGIRRDVPAVMTASNLIVLSSLWEGLPNTVLESMAAARPIVATAVDGTRGVVLDGVTGLLAPPGDPSALARACLRILGDPALGTQMGQAGRARVEAHYSIEAMIQQTRQVYESLLRQRGLSTVAGNLA